MRWFSYVALLSALSIAVIGCGRTASTTGGGKRIKIGFVTNNPAEFWTIVEAGCTKAKNELDVDVLFRRPPNGTAGEQKEIIEDLMTLEVDGIALSVLNPADQTDFINRVVEKVPLIAADNDAPDSKRLCYIGTDNYAAGVDVGKLLMQVMPEGGKVAIFVGKPDPLNARQRRQGVLDALAGQKDAPGPKVYGKYELVDTYYDYNDEVKVKQNAADVLNLLGNEPNIGMVGLWAYNPPGILKAVTEAGKVGKVKIVGMDEHDDTLRGIKEGSIHATVVQDPFGFGYESVKLLTAIAKGDRSGLPSGGIRYVPHRIIKKDNVEAFHKELRQRMGKE